MTQSSIKNKIKFVKQLKNYDIMCVLYGLVPECEPANFIAEGGYGRVYSGLYKTSAVLKVWNTDIKNQKNHNRNSTISELIARMNILYLNPSAHTVNIYQVKQKGDRFYVIMQRCNSTLEQYFPDQKIDDIPELFKMIDQILRGVMHYHSLGIMVGQISFKQIFIIQQGKSKIIKVSLSQSSLYSDKFSLSHSAETYSNDALAYDLKQVAQIIVKLLWRDQAELNISQLQFNPKTPTKMNESDIRNMITLINKVLTKTTTISKLHKEYNQLVYRFRVSQSLNESQQFTIPEVQHKIPQVTRSNLILNKASSYISASVTHKTQKIKIHSEKGQKEKSPQEKKEQAKQDILKTFDQKYAQEFLNALDSLLQDDLQQN